MKKVYSLWTGLCLLGAMAACDDNALEKYDTPDCRLNFVYYNSDSTLMAAGDVEDRNRFYSFSFALASTVEAERDTVWFEVETMGFLSDEARPVALRQIEVEGVENAVAGVHCVAFDAPELAPLYRVEGGKSRALIPVVVLRAPELTEKTVTLKFAFKDNGYFMPGYEGLDTRTMEITDRLAQPDNWYTPLAYNYRYSLKALIGPYGEVKHRLMIEWTDKTWDAEYIEEFLTGDTAYLQYMISFLQKKLAEGNAFRQEEGEDVYREKDGTEVEFVTTWSN